MVTEAEATEWIRQDRVCDALQQFETPGAMAASWQNLHNHGLCLEMTCKYEAARGVYTKAIAIADTTQRQAQSKVGVANCWRHSGHRGNNVDQLREALQVDPLYPQAHFLMSAHHLQDNALEDSVRSLFRGYDIATRLDAEDTISFSHAYVATSDKHPRIYRRGAASLLDMLYSEVEKPKHFMLLHRWAMWHAQDVFVGSSRPAWCFVSEHFREGSVMSNFLPLLKGLLKTSVPKPIILWSTNTTNEDSTTRGLRETPGVSFVTTRPAPVDVVISLDGHTGTGETMRALQQRLGPLQVDYLGYPFTTGSAAIDAKIVDGTTDTEDQDGSYTERLVRLPRCMWAWDRWDAPTGTPAPIRQHALLVCQNFKKLRPAFLSTCQTILHTDPRVTMHFRCTLRADAQAVFEDWVVPRVGEHLRHRLRFVDSPADGDLQRELGTYTAALDTWPYNGTVTTLECLAAGLPVITYQQQHHRGRTTSSILSACGLQRFVTNSADEYCAKALSLVNGDGESEHASVVRAFHNSPIKDSDSLARCFVAAVEDLATRKP